MEAIKSMIPGAGEGDAAGVGDISNPDQMSREDMVKTIENLQKAQKAQSVANDLKSKAMAMTNSKERERMITEAFDKEVEAHGHSKMAKRLQSGTWQGLGFGGGIGAATGIGTGAVLGTVLGAVTAVPTTLLGGAIGTGVGAIRGPFIKLGGKEQKFEDADPEKVVDAMQEESNSQSRQQPNGGTDKDATGKNNSGAEQKQRKKPKKLEIRSQPKIPSECQSNTTGQNVEAGVADESKPKRKPKKLEIRSERNAKS
ncbi:hypothetical protein LTS08_007715 [Lithohypha guttulata]|uniref:uncharacterized protein n=1 Tax=Lithohypha guttulata TaxID=1690604 RepID=UPI002DE16DC7|nr:hypothetical protein LTR51_007368 [Lithohypha guttulata]KAK5096109.1 hypothetical protein LTS08_007715 [Lithohypha guttulata]